MSQTIAKNRQGQKPTAQTGQKSTIKVLVLEWIDRRPSGWVKEGTEGSNPVNIDSASQQFVLPRSVMQTSKGDLVNLRFLKNGKSIIEEEQAKRGDTHNPLTDFIVFEHGVLSVRREGTDINLYDYLKACSFNRDAPNRVDTVQPLFYEIDTEVEAEDNLAELEDLGEALQLVAELRIKRPGNATVYNEDRINALISLFNVHTGDTPAEKLQSLAAIASTRPSYYKKMVDDAAATYKIEIVKGRENGVLSMNGDTASFIDTNRAFHKFNVKGEDERIVELVNYFLAKENAKDFKELVIKNNAAAELKLANQ